MLKLDLTSPALIDLKGIANGQVSSLLLGLGSSDLCFCCARVALLGLVANEILRPDGHDLEASGTKPSKDQI